MSYIAIITAGRKKCMKFQPEQSRDKELRIFLLYPWDIASENTYLYCRIILLYDDAE